MVRNKQRGDMMLGGGAKPCVSWVGMALGGGEVLSSSDCGKQRVLLDEIVARLW